MKNKKGDIIKNIFIGKENRMIITGIPFDEKLNIGVLSKVFERKRISNCYKYFWFQAILENIAEDKVVLHMMKF